MLVAIAVKVNLVLGFIGLHIEYARHKRVWVLMLVVILTLLCVISPRLSNLEIDLVLRVVNRGEVFRHLGFNEVPQLGQFFGFQNRVVDAGRVAHVIACLLLFKKR